MEGWPEYGQEEPSPERHDASTLRAEVARLVALAARQQGLLDALLVRSSQGVLVCDARGALTIASRAAERIWAGPLIVRDAAGWDRFLAWRPDGERIAADAWPLLRALRTGRSVDPEELAFERLDGRRGVILVGAAPIAGEDGEVEGAVTVFTDVTTFKERERDLLAREREAHAEAVAVGERARFLYEASTVIASSLDYEATLAAVAQLAVPRIADWCLVNLSEDLAQRRPPVVIAHKDAEAAAAALELARRYPPDPAAPIGPPAVVRTGEPELYPEITEELLTRAAETPEQVRAWRRMGVVSAMIVPMAVRGRTLGAITFMLAQRGRRYAPADLEMAQHLARRAGFAIDNARLYRQAQDAIRARDEIVAVVSHDLKNPLNAILMSAGLIQRVAGDPERVRRHADAIERSVDRMRALVTGLLDLARMEGGNLPLDRQPTEMGPVIAEAVGAIRSLAQAKRLTVEEDLSGAPDACALCDRERILQVLSNLIGNAIQFCRDGGRVRVRVTEGGDEVLVRVDDEGPGIGREEQRHVFERFWRGRGSRSGTGLGLSIAKGIVEAHGGHIWIESEPGAGATFAFTLPACAPSEAAAAGDA